ncbi:uncharacterized protein LOC109504583 isoform X1 [Harpegnathos saltator]|uniref:uncharacterized protein LOC109504583 isoform X1 n=1 Tax=Harpegnathos saltator TaxID=610380 RepID=UPI000DBEE8FB|nr:uncharacterized protein LOC109504583 isoform X1 [Harpegnathos saltator]
MIFLSLSLSSPVNINPTGNTIDKHEQAGGQNAAKGRQESRCSEMKTMVNNAHICVSLVCVAAFILVNVAWLLHIYFPPHCIKRPTSFSSSEHEDSPSDADPPSGELSSSSMQQVLMGNGHCVRRSSSCRDRIASESVTSCLLLYICAAAFLASHIVKQLARGVEELRWLLLQVSLSTRERRRVCSICVCRKLRYRQTSNEAVLADRIVRFVMEHMETRLLPNHAAKIRDVWTIMVKTISVDPS